MVLRRDDGTSCVSLTCFLMPTAQPSAFVVACLESLPGEHDLEHVTANMHLRACFHLGFFLLS